MTDLSQPFVWRFDLQAKEAAIKAKIPVLPGSPGLKSVQEATAFLQARDQQGFICGIYVSIYTMTIPIWNHLDQYGLFVFVSYPNDFWLDPNWLKNDCDVWLKDNQRKFGWETSELRTFKMLKETDQ